MINFAEWRKHQLKGPMEAYTEHIPYPAGHLQREGFSDPKFRPSKGQDRNEAAHLDIGRIKCLDAPHLGPIEPDGYSTSKDSRVSIWRRCLKKFQTHMSQAQRRTEMRHVAKNDHAETQPPGISEMSLKVPS